MLKTVQKQKREVRMLSRQDRKELLCRLFKKNTTLGLKQKEIFEYLYGSIGNYTSLQIFYLWSQILVDISWLRRNTKFFIISEYDEEVPCYTYTILRTQKQADAFKDKMSRKILFCHQLRKKAQEAVDHKFYKNL